MDTRRSFYLTARQDDFDLPANRAPQTLWPILIFRVPPFEFAKTGHKAAKEGKPPS
jgi:hypothetical protein